MFYVASKIIHLNIRDCHLIGNYLLPTYVYSDDLLVEIYVKVDFISDVYMSFKLSTHEV